MMGHGIYRTLSWAIVGGGLLYAIGSDIQVRRSLRERSRAMEALTATAGELSETLGPLEQRMTVLEERCRPDRVGTGRERPPGGGVDRAPTPAVATAPGTVGGRRPAGASRPRASGRSPATAPETAVGEPAASPDNPWTRERQTYRNVARDLGVSEADLTKIDELAETYQNARRAVADRKLPPSEEKRQRDSAARDFHYALEEVLGGTFNQFRERVSERIGAPRDLP